MGKKNIKIAASMACADFKILGDEIKNLEEADIDMMHFDICDGLFAPTFLFSPLIIKSLRPVTNARFDVHMYCYYPSRYLEEIAASGADLIVIHVEAKENLEESVKKILGFGLKAGIAILPDSSIPEDIEGLLGDIELVIANTVGPAYAGQEFNKKGLINMDWFNSIVKPGRIRPDIAADGGVNKSTIKEIIASGANMLILGSSSLFSGNRDYAGKIRSIREMAEDFQASGEGLG